MPETLAPKRQTIKVKYGQLILDPNNPRFVTRKEHEVPEEEFLNLDLAGATRDKLFPAADTYNIEQLVNSIRQNEWLPVDHIFVRKYKPDSTRYVVLEGNRRVVAIRE